MFNRELFLETQTSRCLLCENAPCSYACTSHLPVSEIIRSFRFENHMGAAEKVGNVSCMDCSNPVCMSACRRKKLDSAVEIPEVLEQIRRIGVAAKPEVDLTTIICGVDVKIRFCFLLLLSEAIMRWWQKPLIWGGPVLLLRQLDYLFRKKCPRGLQICEKKIPPCLLYTSDAADEL